MRPSPTILCLCAVMAASATDSQPIRVDVNLVNVAFSVYNAHGKLAGDLSQDDFEVLEDGVPQRVSFFARSLEVPANPTTLGMRGSAIAWRLTGAISALPTDEASGIHLAADATRDPRVREHALLNGWLTQP